MNIFYNLVPSSDLLLTDTHTTNLFSTGITYATNGEVPRPSMTSVPATESFQMNYTLSCGKVNDHHAHYHVVVNKAETDNVTVDDGTVETSTDLTYTPYTVKKIHSPPKETFSAETAGSLPFGGILVCNNTAAMPLTFESPKEVRILF